MTPSKLNSLLLTESNTDNTNSRVNNSLYVICAICCILTIKLAGEKKMLLRKSSGKENTFTGLCIYHLFTRQIICQHLHKYCLVDVIHATNTRYQKREAIVKKKFVFIYRYEDSCVGNEEVAVWLFYSSLV